MAPEFAGPTHPQPRDFERNNDVTIRVISEISDRTMADRTPDSDLEYHRVRPDLEFNVARDRHFHAIQVPFHADFWASRFELWGILEPDLGGPQTLETLAIT